MKSKIYFRSYFLLILALPASALSVFHFVLFFSALRHALDLIIIPPETVNLLIVRLLLAFLFLAFPIIWICRAAFLTKDRLAVPGDIRIREAKVKQKDIKICYKDIFLLALEMTDRTPDGYYIHTLRKTKEPYLDIYLRNGKVFKIRMSKLAPWRRKSFVNELTERIKESSQDCGPFSAEDIIRKMEKVSTASE
jgi:hypothetical protein